MDRILVTALVILFLLAGCIHQAPEEEATTTDSGPDDEVTTMTNLSLTSPAFDDGETIPRTYGYDEQNINPPLRIGNVPNGTASLALIMDDPDAKEPTGQVWDHWVVFNIPARLRSIPEDWSPSAAVEGENSWGNLGYGGPSPPDGEHTYIFTLYALDTELDLGRGATKEEVENAIDGHVLDKTTFRGTYAP
jgi:Raf kinase inhibitor-like YbhB/YbcL family protein